MTTESFCKTIWNLSYNQVKKYIDKNEYKCFFIPKKNGKRTITTLPPSSSLYGLQKSFLKSFLNRQALPICVKGFIKGENYISYLEPHVGSEYFMRIDINNFFPSITEKNVSDSFVNLLSFDSEDDKDKILELIADICTYNNELPQGVPTSPMVSNIVMSRIDQRITKYCQSLNVIYTRYADDLLFSSNSFSFITKKWFLKKIKFILSSLDLKINYKKLKFGEKEISLNGYVVSNTGIRLSRGRLEDLRKVITFSRNNYPLAEKNPSDFLLLANSINLKYRDLSAAPFKTVFQFEQFLIGYRSYLISFLKYDIDPAFRKKSEKLIQRIEKQIKAY